MATVKFIPDNISITVEENSTILQAARLANVKIESPCNGVGTCGKCKVRLDEKSLSNIVSGGKHHLSKQEEEQGYVLSCEAKILGDITVEIEKQNNDSLKILSKGKSFDVKIEGHIKKIYDSWKDTTYVYGGKELLGTEAGNTVNENYGLVVDIGTTTLVTALIDLNNGKEITSVSSLNPQAIHAQDVLSRIKFASEEKGLEVMYKDIISELKRMIGEIAGETGINTSNIYEVVFSGNTCMLHLAVNANPYSLGKYPYDPLIKGGSFEKASEHKLGIAEFGLIYLPPIISAYVGADITSGILAAQLYEKKGVTLFVDIGTNGEMVISFDGKLSSTSTAAGPAFEGMNITHGMRAGNGAIEYFNIEDDNSITIKTIGGSKAVGICGSGLLDIVGELVANNVIASNGKFVNPQKVPLPKELSERLIEKEGKTVFMLTEEVYLTQKDVRQVQLAKGAIRAGVEFLLLSKEVKAEEVDTVLIAGSFGYHLRAKSLLNIGLLPKEFEGKIDFIGNTSKSGGEAFLLNKTFREKMNSVVNEVEVVELANYKNFDKVFVECLNF